MVERIINKIINDKIDIDKLLVLTFTNAAATEMRERILSAIYKKLDENPNDLNLQKQLVLLNKANISTIHAFCLEIIRNYFYKIDVSPNFRLADSAEIELLKMEVIEDVFDMLYENEDQQFLTLLNTYCSYRDDEALKMLVLKICNYIQSTPFPEEWLNSQVHKFKIEEKKDFSNTIWGRILIKQFKEELNSSINKLKALLTELKKFDDLSKYQMTIQDDISVLEEIDTLKQWDDIYNAVNTIKFKTWPTDKKVISELKEKAKSIRDEVKKGVSSIAKMFAFNGKEALDDISSMYEILCSIQDLVLEFLKKFSAAKKEKNIIDFNDIEHFALKILLEKNGEGTYIPTDVAKFYQDKIKEIAVDEYQDISLVQEKIIKSVSNGSNIFMVGDIKQSIYKFRHARPELFREKYETFGENRIQLYDNFRSKKNILNLTNEIFKTIMTKELGDVEYNEEEFLKEGKEYPRPISDLKTFGKPELNIINKKQADDEEDDILLENAEIEAKFVAGKIKEILNSDFNIYDKKEGYRKVNFKDIAILLRTTQDVSPIYERELKALDYPVFSDTQNNYFESQEIEIILSLLKIIDNPVNDIPLVTVLRSPIGNFKDNELIEIRTEDIQKPFYYSLVEYKGTNNPKLKDKIDIFLEFLKDFQAKQEYLGLDELIWYIYEKTGYYNFVCLMPNGNQKSANLKMLFEKAKDYENSSFKGLYNFINFIEKIKKTNGDMGAPKLIGENDNVIRIMSIHKSKGLEFPIVFLCGTGKQFNFMDLNEKLLMHQDLGFGMQYIDFERRIEYSSLSKEAVKIKLKDEILSEEMRLLYVALTRSREKLIITGIEKDLEKSLKSKNELLASNIDKNRIDKAILKKGKSYLDWLEMINIYNKSFNSVIDVNYYDKSILQEEGKKDTKNKVKIKNVPVSDTVRKLLDYEYKYKDLSSIESKTSVSKITKPSEEKLAITRPSFVKTSKLSKAEIGTAMHLILQKINFHEEYTLEKINQLLEELRAKKILTDAEKNEIDIQAILAFTKTELFKRIKNAKKVYKEKPFYINIPANTLYETKLKDNILVQGIIDLYLIDENDKLVLVDYKTDYVQNGNENELIEKYKAQLMLYKNAIEEALDQKVDEVYIYSLYLNKTINFLG